MRTNQTAPKTIDEYIDGFPHEIQEILEKIRKTIKTAAPDADEAIKYQMPTFTLNGNLVHFAAFKKHIGLYPTPTATEKFREELSAYEGGKGSIRFPLGKPIPYGLISRIVKFRVKENLERAEAKRKKRQYGARNITEFKAKYPGMKTRTGCIDLRVTDSFPAAALKKAIRYAIEHPKP